MILAPHNSPDYPEILESFGLKKAVDMMAYLADIDAGYFSPERFLTFTNRIAQRYGVWVHSVNMRRLEEEVNSRLFPVGWLKLVFGLRKISKYRMWGLGVVPALSCVRDAGVEIYEIYSLKAELEFNGLGL